MPRPIVSSSYTKRKGGGEVVTAAVAASLPGSIVRMGAVLLFLFCVLSPVLAPLASAQQTTTTAAATPVPVSTTPAPTNATVTAAPSSQTISFGTILGGGIAMFVLLIAACYVTLMWQQKALRLYKVTFEEQIKIRGRIRREMADVIHRGERRVFDYQSKANGGDDDLADDDMSPAAMRARILGTHFTAAKYVERVIDHPMRRPQSSDVKQAVRGPLVIPAMPLTVADETAEAVFAAAHAAVSQSQSAGGVSPREGGGVVTPMSVPHETSLLAASHTSHGGDSGDPQTLWQQALSVHHRLAAFRLQYNLHASMGDDLL